MGLRCKESIMEKKKKSKPTKLKAICKDGKEIQCPFAWQTLAEVIEKIGVEKVMKLNRENRGRPLISKERFSDIKQEYQKEIGNGFYLYTKSCTKEKLADIKAICEELNVDWIEDVVIN